MKIHLWGIRGSLPSPHTPLEVEEKIVETLRAYDARRSDIRDIEKFVRSLRPDLGGGFGGHTACFEITSPKTRLIIDGGSGIRCLGEKLMLESAGVGRGTIHILMTHFHWDHLIGLPFFTPIFLPGNQIHFYAVQDDLEENIKRVFGKPNFPVPFENLPANIHFHKIKPREKMSFDDIDVIPFQLDHPDPCWGYRLEHDGKVYAHAVDTEATRVTREELGEDAKMYENADLLIFDAQYTFLEAAEKINWGHASGPIGIDIAMREKIKRVLFIHHDPGATDAKILEAERQTREYYDSALSAARAAKEDIFEVDWEFAREGMEIQL